MPNPPTPDGPVSAAAPPTHPTDAAMLDDLLLNAFHYFLDQTDPVTGLVADKSTQGSPCSIGVMGMALSAYTVGVERRLISRSRAARCVATALQFLYAGPQGKEKDAMGYKGFYYHFIDCKTGRRAWKSELSTIDTAFFIAGALSVAAYFDADDPDEQTIRGVADKIYRRVDWRWAQNGNVFLSHGWKPGRGFLPYDWNDGYNEAMILYVLAMGSPTFPIHPDGYKQWTATFQVRRYYDIEYIYAGPLFIHQFSHLWIDFRGIADERNRATGYDYFENSRRATLVHRRYGIENPQRFHDYCDRCWGLSAGDGPGPATRRIDGRRIKFYGYVSRGAPEGPDDGTVSPWAVVASLPFSPGIVLEAMRYYYDRFERLHPGEHAFNASFNPTFPNGKTGTAAGVSPCCYGLNEGAMVLMIDNYQTGRLWQLLRSVPYVKQGLIAGGFAGDWLN